MENQTSAHAVYNLKLHIVFATKYRRKTLRPELLAYLEISFGEILAAWRCELLEFGGEPDHVHRLVSIHPALDISVLINHLKTASARRARLRFAEHLARYDWKPLFWYRAYFVSSVGGASLATVKAYVERQGTEEHARRKGKAAPDGRRRLAPPPEPVGPRRGNASAKAVQGAPCHCR